MEKINRLLHVSKVKSEQDLQMSIGKQFENVGWKVIYNYRARNKDIDIALFQGDLLVAGVEIRALGLSRLNDKNRIIQQCKYIMDYYGLEVFYCFLEDKLYALKGTCLIEQSKFPSPIQKEKEDIIYTETTQNGFLYKNVDNSVIDPYLMSFIQGIRKEILKIHEEINKSDKNNVERFNKLEKKVDKIDTTTNETKEIVLKIDEKLSSMIGDIKKVKKTSLDIEDKIGSMEQCIDENMKKINLADIELYNWTVKNWLSSNYENIEPQSKMYLPSAEYLYDALCKIEEVDFSPFILQYCRSLECEILQKLFRAFVKDIKAKGYNVNERYENDLKKVGQNHHDKPSCKFAKTVSRYMDKEENEWMFELGTMQHTMNLVADGYYSPIIKDFKEFIEEKFNSGLINHDYISELEDITKNYRNKSAHPNYITYDEAQKGKEEIRKALNEFLNCYKKQ